MEQTWVPHYAAIEVDVAERRHATVPTVVGQYELSPVLHAVVALICETSP